MTVRSTSLTHPVLQFLIILLLSTIHVALSGPCTRSEWAALQDLKKGLTDPGGRLSSWVGDDCCSWPGIGCDNRTGNVVHIDLHLPAGSNYSLQLSGVFSSSTLHLEHLQYLDLSGNDFGDASVPAFLDSFKELRYLDLSSAGFSGTVPALIGNISGLQYLDLSSNYFSDDPHGNVGWMRALGGIKSLKVLNISYSGLSTIPGSLPSGSFGSLSFLDISLNNFGSVVPEWLFEITSLQHLQLSGNSFQGPLPSSIGKMASLSFLAISPLYNATPIPNEIGELCNLKILDLSYSSMRTELNELENIFIGCVRDSLEHLDLSGSELTGKFPNWIGLLKNLISLRLFRNSIYGSVPSSLGELSSLQELRIGSNLLNGTIAESIGQLSSLVSLDLSENSLTGVLSEASLSNLTRLQFLDMSSNSVVLHVPSDWVPPFRLQKLYLSHCKLGPHFPRWLRSQESLTHLDLSRTGISDTMPDWFWSLASRLNYLDLSNNQISGRLPDSLVLGEGDFLFVRLNSNRFHGPVPRVPSNVARLELSNNLLSGQIPASFADGESILELISLSANNLTGTVPSSVCKLRRLHYLDVSSNHLSGELPNCWNESSKSIEGLNFTNNNFTGGLPGSVCTLPSLVMLHLSNNNLTGTLQPSLKNCVELVTLDLSFNRLTGPIPTWMGESLTRLVILSLRSNLLEGNIPPQLSKLARLRILDLSGNRLSSTIPPSFGNFSAMKDAGSSPAPILTNFINFDDHMILLIKGVARQYERLLSFYKVMDLSDNNLAGNIPAELAGLVGLERLNLSMNHLTGGIIKDIGSLSQLMSLDLSRNELSGRIPPSLGTISNLAVLNLSCNSLSGEIPQSNQLRTLVDPSIYAGNRDLCGFPLPSCVSSDGAASPMTSLGEGELENEVDWTIVGLTLGFVVGNSIVYWVILLHKRRRDAYFEFVDGLYDRIPFVPSKNSH